MLTELCTLVNHSYLNTFEYSQDMLYLLSPFSFKFCFMYVVLLPWDETIKSIEYS